MGKIYVNQSKLRLQLNTGVDITGATAQLVKYTKPDETVGNFSALILDAEVGSIYHDFINGELNAAGNWIFWSYVTFADGRSAPGESVKIRVYVEGT